MAITHQPGLLEQAQMLRHDRLRYAGPRRQGADGLLPLAAEPLEQRPPGRISEGLEDHVLRGRHLDRYPVGYG